MSDIKKTICVYTGDLPETAPAGELTAGRLYNTLEICCLQQDQKIKRLLGPQLFKPEEGLALFAFTSNLADKDVLETARKYPLRTMVLSNPLVGPRHATLRWNMGVPTAKAFGGVKPAAALPATLKMPEFMFNRIPTSQEMVALLPALAEEASSVPTFIDMEIRAMEAWMGTNLPGIPYKIGGGKALQAHLVSKNKSTKVVPVAELVAEAKLAVAVTSAQVVAFLARGTAVVLDQERHPLAAHNDLPWWGEWGFVYKTELAQAALKLAAAHEVTLTTERLQALLHGVIRAAEAAVAGQAPAGPLLLEGPKPLLLEAQAAA